MANQSSKKLGLRPLPSPGVAAKDLEGRVLSYACVVPRQPKDARLGAEPCVDKPIARVGGAKSPRVNRCPDKCPLWR
jgi:hypothetical protein